MYYRGIEYKRPIADRSYKNLSNGNSEVEKVKRNEYFTKIT